MRGYAKLLPLLLAGSQSSPLALIRGASQPKEEPEPELTDRDILAIERARLRREQRNAKRLAAVKAGGERGQGGLHQ